MRKRGLCCRPVSVCLSVCHVGVFQTAEEIVKLLSRSSSPIILVFWPTAPAGTQFQGNPFSGGAKYKGMRFFCDFQLKSSSTSDAVRDRLSCYGTLIGKEVMCALSNEQWPWLNFLSVHSCSQNFPLLSYVCLRRSFNEE